MNTALNGYFLTVLINIFLVMCFVDVTKLFSLEKKLFEQTRWLLVPVTKKCGNMTSVVSSLMQHVISYIKCDFFLFLFQT